MSRELKRVPLTFDWPLNAVWPGYQLGYYGRQDYELVEKYLSDEELGRKVEPPTGEAYQMWETVSEGSPISPPFATKEELADWLGEHKNDDLGGSRDDWMAVINAGWCMSGMFQPGVGFMTGVKATGYMADDGNRDAKDLDPEG